MNIPSPYRWHLFTKLYDIGRSKGIELHVAFLSPQSVGRRWRLDDFPRSFPFSVPWGVNLSRSNDRLFNPGLILCLLYEQWDWIILGGYDNPTTAMLAALPLPNVGIKLIRNEGNLNAFSRFTEGPMARVKKLLLSRCDGYLVPGQRGIEWLNYWLPDRGRKPVHIFPNVIDDRTLVSQVTALRQKRTSLRQRLGIAEAARVFLIPARLSPEKGMTEFLQCLPADFGDKAVWLIAGEGPLQQTIESILISKQLQSSVRLLGYVPPSEMPELYAVADIFVLPSLSDRNPLSAIEAAFSGLPLLVSKRIGNYPELMVEGTTGWGFDPFDSLEIRKAIEEAVNCTREQLQWMSAEVLQRALMYFQSDRVCANLLEFLLSIHPDARDEQSSKERCNG